MTDPHERAQPAQDLSSPSEGIRASDGEREATIQRLRDGAAEGRLTFEELADRVEVAAHARTREELTRVTGDLPAPAGSPAVGRANAAELPTRRSALFGDVRCSGAWRVPAAGKWETLFGDVVLDLREATVGEQDMRINAGTIFGDVELLVPEGIEVEVRSRTLLGTVRQDAGAVAHPGAPRVVLTGGTVFGDVRVRNQRLRERLAERLRA